MPSLKEVRIRISSVASTKQITSAMKMVSASKLRKAQDAIVSMRPYAFKLKEILENLSSSLDTSEGIYSKQREIRNVLIIVITSNRGLCGAFNSNVIKLTNKLAYDKYKENSTSVICIGKKGADYFRKTELGIMGSDMPKRLYGLYDELTFDNVAPVAEKIMSFFIDGEFDKIELVYNRFKNASVQILTAEQFLPVQQPPSGSPQRVERANAQESQHETDDAGGDNITSNRADYIFEPDKEEIVQDLIPKSLKVQFYKALLESYASEHGARMTAMHKATDNATELLKDLKLSYNKARQAAITNEILEIVGGAEALKN